MPIHPLLLFVLLSGCSQWREPSLTPEPGTSLPALGESRVLSFRRTAIMDTVTAILEGTGVSLCTHHPVPVTVQLAAGTTSYQAIAAPNGTFRFFHIPAGKYTLTATHPACCPLGPRPVELGTGVAIEVKLGMRCYSSKS